MTEAKDDHERAVVRGAARVVCAEWNVEIIGFDYPEDERPVPDRPLDGIVRTTGSWVAVEHTLYLSFPRQIDDSKQIEATLAGLVERVTGTLPAPGTYELHVAPGAVAGHGRTDLSPLELWIREVAPILSVGRAPGHFAEGRPPEVPFAVSLYRWDAREGAADGTLRVGRPIDFEALPTLNVEQTASALSRKLPKLDEHRPPGGRTLLVFEEPDIQLVNTTSATRAVRTALESMPHLPEPSAIVLVYTFAPEWSLMWIKDGDSWHPDMDRGVIRVDPS